MKSAIALLILAAGAQEKVKLEVRAKKGDAFTHSASESSEISYTLHVGSNKSTQKISQKEVRQQRDEVLAVEGTAPSEVRRKIGEWWSERKVEGSGVTDRKARKVQGRTLLLRKKGDATEIEGAQGVPEEELARVRLKPDALVASLPAGPVAVGHEWTLDEAKFREELGAGSDGDAFVFKSLKAVARFEKIETVQGQRCAVIAVTVDAQGAPKGQDKLSAVYQLKNTTRLALESGRILGTRGSGTIAVQGTVDQDGVPCRIDASFAITTESANVWE